MSLKCPWVMVAWLIKSMAVRRGDKGLESRGLPPLLHWLSDLFPASPISAVWLSSPVPTEWSRGRLRLSLSPERPWVRTRQLHVRHTGAYRQVHLTGEKSCGVGALTCRPPRGWHPACVGHIDHWAFPKAPLLLLQVRTVEDG